MTRFLPRFLALLSLSLSLLVVGEGAWGQTIVQPGGPGSAILPTPGTVDDVVVVGPGTSGVRDGGAIGAINITNPTYGASASASDNATAIQAAITAAVAAGKTLYIPAAASCYKYTAPLTISGNLSIVGDWVAGNWPGTNQINVPSSSPQVVGSVLCPTANGSDALDISGTALQVNVSNIGILFQTTLGQSSTTTGDAFHYVPSGTNQGLSGGSWNNVFVYGHDGNHYAFNFQNPILGTFNQLSSVGGGGFNLRGNSTTLQFGNMVFTAPYSQVIVGGSAHGFNISASQANALNLILFNRPQSITNNISGVTPAANPPTSAQVPWNCDANSSKIRAIAADMETNVSSFVNLCAPALQNDFDWAGSTTSNSAGVNSPAWLTNGLMYGPLTRTLNDTTSSGTVANAGVFAFPSTHVTATTATTYTLYSTLFVGTPIAGTNVTMPSPLSIYASGGITSAASLAGSGLFVTGTAVINNNASTNTSKIGTGTTSGAVTIGGTSNTTSIASALDLTASAFTTAGCTALTVTITTGAVNCTASAARLKTIYDDATVTPAGAAAGLDKLRIGAPVWEYNDKDTYGPGIRVGLIADDVGQMDPRCVTRRADDDAINDYWDRCVIAYLVADRQNMKTKIDNLERKVLWLDSLPPYAPGSSLNPASLH